MVGNLILAQIMAVQILPLKLRNVMKVMGRVNAKMFLPVISECSAVRLAYFVWDEGVSGSNPDTRTIGKCRFESGSPQRCGLSLMVERPTFSV